MSRGRRTNREVYVLKEWDLPKQLPGAEWQLDKTFNWLMNFCAIPS
jgi:hypothetical protein